MNHMPPSAPGPTPGRGTETPTEIADETAVGDVLSALEDDECRAILEATSTTALSAGEVAETCDIALSTTYRKLDQLDEAGLLEEQIRISDSGKHKSEYRLQFEDITVSVDPETGFELSFAGSEQEGSTGWAPAGAD